ncbi:MAG: metal-dependent hydrolase [Thermomicrobiales bacterium]|nr:metal-dependent hydrolase [Thermomicrobiales bacterium]
MSFAPAEVIDAHLHFGADPAIAEHLTVPELIFDDPDSLIQTLDCYVIDRAVVLPPDRVLNPPRDFDFREANEAVARAVAKHPDRLLGAMRLNPLFGEAFVWDTVKHFVELRGLRGIKLVARADFYNPASLHVMGPVLEAAGHYGITVLFHSGHPSRDLPSLQAYSAKHYPNTRVVLAHMGLHDFLHEAIIACKEIPNLFADMSQAWPYDIKAFVRAVGADRLMYGSDAPFQSPKVERVKVEECRFSDRELELIFHENAKRIWGFDDR